MRFHAGEMDQIEKDPRHHLAYTLYDESDGLQPGTQMWQSGAAGVRDLAGRIWVVDGPGMTIIDPRQLREAQACLASEPGGRDRQRRARQHGGRPALREQQHRADRIRRPQPLGHLEAALPPPSRRRRLGLGVRRETAGAPPTPTCGPATIDSVSAPRKAGRGPSRRCGRSPSIRRSI